MDQSEPHQAVWLEIFLACTNVFPLFSVNTLYIYIYIYNEIRGKHVSGGNSHMIVGPTTGTMDIMSVKLWILCCRGSSAILASDQ